MDYFYRLILLLSFLFPPAILGQTSSETSLELKDVPVQSAQKPASRVLGLPNNSFTVEGGYGFGDLGPSNNQAFRLSFSQPRKYRFSFDIGRQFRFKDSSIGAGVAYCKTFSNDIAFDFGAGTGTGLLASRYRFSLGVSKPIFKIGLSANYTRIQSKGENSSDGVSVGGVRWLGHWIISGSTRMDVGHPGATLSNGAAFGITYYVYRKTYIGLGADYGRASYLITGLATAHINYSGWGYNLGFSRWLTPRRGFSLSANYGVTSFYKAWGITFSPFQEW
jgi:YaiO family outer membrane protein